MKKINFGAKGLEKTNCIISIGVFDGLHKGHMKIIKRNVELAHKLNASSMIITFSKNPKMYLGRMIKRKPLSTQRLDEEIFTNIGVDYHCVIDFSDNISKLSGEEFLNVLSRFCIIRGMVVGNDFHCGEIHNSYGPSQLGDYLKRSTTCSVFEVLPDVLNCDGKVISSTSVRSCLLTGDLEIVNKLLGRRYTLDKLPILPDENEVPLFSEPFKSSQLLPPQGTYEVRVILSNGHTFETQLEIGGNCLNLLAQGKGNIDRIEFIGRSKNAYKRKQTGNC